MNKSNTPSKGKTIADDLAPKSIQEIANIVVGKDELKPPFTPVSEKDANHPPLLPATPDDVDGNVITPHNSSASFTEKWQAQISSAKTTWSKLTEEELLNSDGHEHKLAGLIQGRYCITRDEANRQVKGFIEKFVN